MDIAVPSRFACLKIEDDDFRPASSKPKKKPENKQQPIKKLEKSIKQDSNKKTTNKSVSEEKMCSNNVHLFVTI